MTDPNVVLDSLAATLYDAPSSKQATVEAKQQAPSADEALAAKLYGPKPALPNPPVPEGIAKLRAGEVNIYDRTSAFSDIGDEDLLGEGARPGATPFRSPEEKAVAQEMRRQFADLGLSNVDAKEIARLGRELGKNPPTKETEAKWASEICKRLLDNNHQRTPGATADLKLAQQLVQRDPRVRAMLNATRLGSHPAVVEMLVERAQAEKLAGRL